MLQYETIQETVAFIDRRTDGFRPEVAIVLGSGLGKLAKRIEVEHRIPYGEIVHFPESTVKGHKGELILGHLGGRRVVAMSGRFHYYEGYSIQQVVFPIYVMKFLGARTILLSNAAGGMKEGMAVGDLMLINDHIYMQPAHPLTGPNDERLGPRFPDMFDCYSPRLIEAARDILRTQGEDWHEGVYVGVQGPTFETRAEYALFHQMGGHAVGMSTVPEVVCARHGGLEVFAVSVITDLGWPPGAMDEISHDDVVQAATGAEPRMTALVEALLERI